MTQLEIVIKRLSTALKQNLDKQFLNDLDWAYQYFELEDWQEVIENTAMNNDIE